jgi:hypothetical protein
VSQEDLFGAPAGWYPDPLGLPQLRWWNNHAWTEQTSAARQPMVMQDTKFAWADDDLPTRREERERERTRDESELIDNSRPTAETLRELNPPQVFTKLDDASARPAPAEQSFGEGAEPVEPIQPRFTTEPATQSNPTVQADPTVQATPAPEAPPAAEATLAPAEPAYVPHAAQQPVGLQTGVTAIHDESLDALFGTREPRQTVEEKTAAVVAPEPAAPTTVKTALVSTGPAWIIAMIPLFQLVSSLLLINFGLGSISALFIGVLTAPYFVVIALAIADYRLLKRGGNTRPAHWAWALLTAPVYLLMRARAVISQSGRGIGPVLVWFALAFLHIASVVAIPGLIISVVPNLFVPQIEASIARDAKLISGTNLTVNCPPAPPVLIGEQVVCTSVNPNGSSADITVSLSRSNGWIAWQVVDWGVYTIKR